MTWIYDIFRGDVHGGYLVDSGFVHIKRALLHFCLDEIIFDKFQIITELCSNHGPIIPQHFPVSLNVFVHKWTDTLMVQLSVEIHSFHYDSTLKLLISDIEE